MTKRFVNKHGYLVRANMPHALRLRHRIPLTLEEAKEAAIFIVEHYPEATVEVRSKEYYDDRDRGWARTPVYRQTYTASALRQQARKHGDK